MQHHSRYEIERLAPGVLAYREGCKELQFPLFEEDGEIVFVEWPTRQRILFALASWAWRIVPKEFSEADRQRITPRVVALLRREGRPVRVMAPTPADESIFEFRPELFASRGRATEVLAEAGLDWFSDYTSIDVIHEEYGLQVCGIQEKAKLGSIIDVMRKAFPHWHYYGLCRGCLSEPGFKFAIHMFPRRDGCGS